MVTLHNLDDDKSGTIQEHEFVRLLKNKEARDVLCELHVDTKHLDEVKRMIYGQEGSDNM